MATVYLQLIAKNSAHIGQRHEFESDVVPRVGELIDADRFLQKLGSSHVYYIVESVIYELTEKGFAPYITAREWYKGGRQELLEKRGWLPSTRTADDFTYDEDDPCL